MPPAEEATPEPEKVAEAPAAEEPPAPKAPSPPVVEAPAAKAAPEAETEVQAEQQAAEEAPAEPETKVQAAVPPAPKSKKKPAKVRGASEKGRLSPPVAAAFAGAVSGLAAVVMTVGAVRGCEAIRGESSCGGGFGLLALVAILAIEVLIGANLLRSFKISDPLSTSFLGVGLVAMVAMLFFLDVISSPWMFGVIPVATAIAFLLSWWVTVRFVEEQADE